MEMAKARQQYLGVYENMDFPDYKFEEYPKVVGYRDEKKTVPIIVGNAKEEVEFITTGSPGAHISREEELQAELDRAAMELEVAKKQLAELKAGQDKAKASLPLPAGKKEG
jgi:hypothetical protein